MCTHQHQDLPIIPEWFVATCNSFLFVVCSYLHVSLGLQYKEKSMYVCAFFPILNLLQSMMLTLKQETEDFFFGAEKEQKPESHGYIFSSTQSKDI